MRGKRERESVVNVDARAASASFRLIVALAWRRVAGTRPPLVGVGSVLRSPVVSEATARHHLAGDALRCVVAVAFRGRQAASI